MDLETWVEEIDDLRAGMASNVRYVLEDAIKENLPIARAKLIPFANDGNTNVGISYEVSGSRGDYEAIVELTGSQAEFVEYGYGAIGEGTYPPGDPWEYDINGHGEKGWYYAHGKKSHGMEAGAVMYDLVRDISDSLDDADRIIEQHRAKRRKK